MSNVLSDNSTTIQEARQIVEEFVAQRDWQQFHSPKNLSMALAIEAAELMEHFQWIKADESRSLEDDKKQQVAEEMSDVFCYLLALANELGLDLSQAFSNKMIKNRAKYPQDEYRGRYGADDPNPTSSTADGSA